jgi:hypothetical protein
VTERSKRTSTVELGNTMRIRRTFIATLAAVALSSCSEERVTAPVVRATPVLLQDIVVPRLPSPYYHFEYDSTGRATKASFASGFTMYDVTYDRDRIVEMRDNTAGDQDRLVYAYDNAGRVTTIRYVNEAELVYTVLSFTYDGQKLTRVVRDRILGGAFVIDKTTTLSYDADGNVRELTEHRPAIDGLQTETTMTDRFEQYDDKINVDAFGLLHSEFFDHLILLPDVQLQKGNPGRVTHTGDGVNYRVDFTYIYDDRNRPLTKTGEFIWLNGPDVGEKFQTLSMFSYY